MSRLASPCLAPVVVALVVVVVAVAVVAGLIGLTLGGLGRHRSRTRDQESTIYTLRTAVVALVQTSTQGWTAADSSVRPTIVAQLPLISDGELRQLTNDLLDTTRRLGSPGGNPEERQRLHDELDDRHERFRLRSNEVIRELKLGRVPRRP